MRYDKDSLADARYSPLLPQTGTLRLLVPPPLSPDLSSAVIRSAGLLAQGMIADLGSARTGEAQVEVERFIEDSAFWAADPASTPLIDQSRRHALGERALLVIARWDERFAVEAAAWQLLLSAMAMAQPTDERDRREDAAPATRGR